MQKLLVELEQKKGLLVIDEAFMDACQSNQSMAKWVENPHLIVLRSVGKFFGLAGMRLGFTLAHPQWLALFEEQLGPWQVNGPALFVGQQALSDTPWQIEQKERLHLQSMELKSILISAFIQQADAKLPAVSGTALFQTLKLDRAQQLYEQLCQQAIYVRLTDHKDALRFGLFKPEQKRQLVKALRQLPIGD